MLSCRACHATSGDDMRYCGTCGEPLHDDVPVRSKPRESRVLPSGTVVGSYKLLQVLGEGGMGRVYLAEHTRLGRKVAIKMLRSKFSSNPESIKRFFGEARAVNKIAHENIVEVTDFVTEDDGNSYYIMELLTGKSLYDQLKEGGVMPLERSLSVAIQVANALGAVHEAGIVHRDLKPENIFLVQKGSRKDIVKLLDFGIAKLMEPDQGVSLQQTGVGMILGTPTYMSPEQAGGRGIDSRSDVYSLGVILFELSTGQVPFTADTYAEILVQHITQEPRRPSTIDALPAAVPPGLEQLILDCLRKDPADRPQKMTEVEDRLRTVLDELGRVVSKGTVVGTGPLAAADRPSYVTPASRPVLSRQITARPTPTPAPQPTPAPVLATAMPLAPATTTISERRPRRIGLIVLLLAPVLGGAVAAVAVMNGGDGDGDKPATVSAPVQEKPVQDKTELVAPPSATPAAATGDGKVRLRVESTPAGADVFRAGSDTSLGTTPLDTRLPRSDEPARFELRKKGFLTASQETRLDDDAYVSIGLAPAPAPPVSAAAVKPIKKRPTTPPVKKPRHRKSDRTIEKGGVLDFE
ncbi:MAG TPA: serine/threonine-protein kinase [Kofleriaceae bacterium]